MISTNQCLMFGSHVHFQMLKEIVILSKWKERRALVVNSDRERETTCAIRQIDEVVVIGYPNCKRLIESSSRTSTSRQCFLPHSMRMVAALRCSQTEWYRPEIQIHLESTLLVAQTWPSLRHRNEPTVRTRKTRCDRRGDLQRERRYLVRCSIQ